MFDTIKSIFRPQATALKVISVTSAVDYAELPQGFFRVEAASGRKTLGYNCTSFLCWDVGTTIVVGGNQRITLEKSPEELPLVKLNFRSQMPGVQQVGGRSVVDTDVLDGYDGSVSWAGATPARWRRLFVRPVTEAG